MGLKSIERLMPDDDEMAAQARAIYEKSLGLVDCLEPRPYDNAPGEARKKEIISKLPPSAQLLGYIDCGAKAIRYTGPFRMLQLNGKSWRWPASNPPVSPTFSTIAFATLATIPVSTPADTDEVPPAASADNANPTTITARITLVIADPQALDRPHQVTQPERTTPIVPRQTPSRSTPQRVSHDQNSRVIHRPRPADTTRAETRTYRPGTHTSNRPHRRTTHREGHVRTLGAVRYRACVPTKSNANSASRVTQSMLSRTAAPAGSRINGVNDTSSSASDRAAHEAVRIWIANRTPCGHRPCEAPAPANRSLGVRPSDPVVSAIGDGPLRLRVGSPAAPRMPVPRAIWHARPLASVPISIG